MKIEIIKSGAPRPLANYNECFKVGPWVFAAGQIASDYKTGVAPEARRNPAFPYYGSDIKLQTHYVLGNLKKTFETAGSSLDHVVKAQVFMTDLGNFNAFDEVWRDYFKVPPARTTIGTTGLLVPGTLVEIDLIGYVPGRGIERKAIKSAAPQPLANYTEAFTVGNLIFAAGQLASDFKSGVPVVAKKDLGFPFYGSDIKKQTRFILDNLKQTFAAAGGSLDEVLKAQVFMTDLADFNAFDEVWKGIFQGAAGAHDHRHVRASGRGHLGRDRSRRPPSRPGLAAGGGHLEQSQAARQLYRGVPCRRPGVRGGPDRVRLLDRGRERSEGRSGVSVLRLVDQEADPLHPQQPEEHLRSGRQLA
jgi:enamine deaminase RidA (YjgF/YER057c/UK114 family)